MKIGVFDSGIGGKSIADSIQRDFLDAEILYVNDIGHMPYGSRSAKEITELTDNAIQPLLISNCDVIVLACNSATAAAIEFLRKKYPKQQFIGLEPMVKTAASLTKTKVVAICATPFTLSSERYKKLKEKFASNIKVIEPDCADWASMIENNTVNDEKISNTIKYVCNKNADVIVLACTHYHWIKKQIQSSVSNQAIVIDPSEAISKRISNLLLC